MQFQTSENKARSSDYHKNESEEEFIKNLNDSLAKFEEHREQEIFQLPWIFVTGLPRSGTTLLMQVLSAAFDLGFVNNFMARLWNAPVSAAKMSKILFGKERYTSDFRSDHGKTTQLQDPHEWSYFWIDRLKYNRSIEFDRKKNEDRIDWNEIQLTLDQLTHVLQKSFLCKALHPAKYVSQFQKMNPNIYFLHIERDFLENCTSMKEAREGYYNDPNEWWSLIPDNYAQIKDLPYEAQIPEQLYALQSEMKNDLSQVPEDHKLSISFTELCADPHAVMTKVAANFNLAFNSDLDFSLENIPLSFPRRKREHMDEKMRTYIKNNFPEVL